MSPRRHEKSGLSGVATAAARSVDGEAPAGAVPRPGLTASRDFDDVRDFEDVGDLNGLDIARSPVHGLRVTGLARREQHSESQC